VNAGALLDWLLGLPPSTLLPAMALLAALENVFPPIPADVLIALGAFIAARNDASPLPAFAVVLVGNVAGAMVMYAVGRRYGAAWTEERFHLRHKASADVALSAWYARYGLLALCLGRFIPGVRAIVAPFGGALRAPVIGTAAAITLASGAWYGLVTWIAFRAGSNWEQLLQSVQRLGTATGVVALVIVAGIVAAFLLRRRRRRPPDDAA
jgi:membrane protein DedA with SNARE-associated domain